MSVEELLQEKGLNAPRITPEVIQDKIRKTEFHRLTDVLTVCVLTLENGSTVTGESACASPANFNEEIGERIALENATDKIWMLEGYLLKERLRNFELQDGMPVDAKIIDIHQHTADKFGITRQEAKVHNMQIAWAVLQPQV